MARGDNSFVKLLILLFIGTGFWACTSRETTPSKNYKIAYNVLYDGYANDYEIFVMNSDGSEQKNVSLSSGVDWVYHAHGDRLYFISDRDTTSRNYFLYEMKWDGTEVRRITDFLVHDSWIDSRKNGTELVVVPNFGENQPRNLYLIDLEGNILQQLTDNMFNDDDPSFSPDGSQIAFRSNRGVNTEIFIMNVDGSELRQLTEYPAADTSAYDWEYHAGPPQWVDSTRITYISKQNNNYSIFSISPLTGENYQMTPDTTEEGFPSNEGWHTWLPDGSEYTYNSTDWRGNFDIYVMEMDSNKVRKLTYNDLYEQAPVYVFPVEE